MGAVSSSHRETNQPWAINTVVQNFGADSAILSLSTDGNQVYGTAYDYVKGQENKFEGTFAATAPGGSLVWLTTCNGDTYDGVPIGNVFYSVGHAHNCTAIGGNPELSPRQYQYAMATTTYASGTNGGTIFPGKPKPALQHWDALVRAGHLHRQVSGGLDDHRQLPVRGGRRRVPQHQRDQAAGPGSFRGEGLGPQQAGAAGARRHLR